MLIVGLEDRQKLKMTEEETPKPEDEAEVEEDDAESTEGEE